MIHRHEPESVRNRLNRARREYVDALREAADAGDTGAILELSALEAWMREAAQVGEDVVKVLQEELAGEEEDGSY